MPLVGIRCRLDAMLMTACRPKPVARPVAPSSTNMLCSLTMRDSARSTMKAKQDDQQQADDEAELLARDGEDEIGMRVGQHHLDRAFARAAAGQAAVLERLERAVDLVGVAGAGSRNWSMRSCTWGNMK